jgi:hypothetical protein
MPVRSVKITANTVITDLGGTFHGIIWYAATGATANAVINVFDDDDAGSPTKQIAKFHTAGSFPAGNDFRGFEIVCKTGITVTASSFTNLEIYVLYN